MASKLHFLLTAGAVVPELPFPSRVCRAFAFDQSNGRGGYDNIANVRARLLEVDLPGRDQRTLGQYKTFKEGVRELRQVFNPVLL